MCMVMSMVVPRTRNDIVFVWPCCSKQWLLMLLHLCGVIFGSGNEEDGGGNGEGWHFCMVVVLFLFAALRVAVAKFFLPL